MAFNLDELLGPFEGHKKIVDELERWKKAQIYGEEELRKWQLRSEIAKKEQPKPTLKPQTPETILADKLKQVGKVAIQALEGFGTALRPFEAEAYYAQYPERRPPEPTTTAEKIARTGGELAATVLPAILGGAGIAGAAAKAPGVARTAVQTVARTYRALPKSVQIGTAIGVGATAEEVVRGTITPKAKEQTLPAKLGASLRAGFGDVLSLTGSVAEMVKQESAAEKLRRAAEKVRTGFEAEPVEFDWKAFFDPDWYAVNVARSVPLTLALIPAMYLGWRTGGAVGARLGLGPFGRAILSSVVGAAASRPLEAAFEAAGTYEDYLAQNPGDIEGAERAAKQTFIKNLPLGALDLAELATAFAPVQIKPLSRISETLLRAAEPNLGRVLRASARALGAAPQEAIEEGIQEAIQRHSLGQPVTLDSKMMEAMAIGGLFGAGMGGVGSIVEHIQRKTLEKLSPELRDEIITKAQDNAQTLPPEQAIEQALDDVMASDEKKKAEVESAVEKTIDDLDKTIKRATASRTKKAKTARVEAAKTEAAPTVAPVEPATAPPVVQPTREPWQMTLEEFAQTAPSASYRETVEMHRKAVEQALAEGKPVPEEVLADYPELRPAAEAPVAVTPPVTETSETDLLNRARQLIASEGIIQPEKVTVTLLQRRLKIGYKRASELAEKLKAELAAQQVTPVVPELSPAERGRQDAMSLAIEELEKQRGQMVTRLLNPNISREETEYLSAWLDAAAERLRAVEETPAAKPEAPEVPETTRRKVSPKVGGTYTAKIVKKFRNLEEGQEITGRVDRIIKYKSGLVVARVETADGQTIDVPVSKYAEWYPAGAVAPAIEAPPTEEIAGAEVPKSAKIEAEETGKTPAGRIADFVFEKLRKGEAFTSAELFKVADEAYGSTQAEGKYTPKDAYDAMELGVNRYIYETFKGYRLPNDISKVEAQLELIKKNILDKIPTQTKRTAEQEEFQQFSTPPNLAYVASWVANISPEDTVLEPSAGIGGLAVFAKATGAETVVNELSLRRAALLRQLGFDRVFTENAEQLHNVLPRDVRPTVVIMNPPFSATAGRMEGKRATKNAILHIEQALKRLEPGGRLVAIVGRGMADNAPTFRDWWKEIKKEYNVRANVGIDGKNYVKYGTGFDVQLVVIDKTGPTPEGGTITGNITDLKDIFPLLEGIRNERVVQPIPRGKLAEQTAGEPVREGTPEEGRGGPGPERSVPAPTGGVGTEAGGGAGVSVQPPEDRMGKAEAGSGRGGQEGLAGIREEVVSTETPPEAHGPAPEERPVGRRAVGGPEGAGEEEVTGRGGGVPGGEPAGSVPGEPPARHPEGLKVEAAETPRVVEEELTDAVYTPYQPQKLKIPGAKPHPGFLAQSAAMAAVEPPAPTYTPNLPKEIVEEGKLSIAQLEAVVYAGQAHQQVLPSGERRGFFIGDGTGVGKGREISGIILDNMRQGRKKAVWVSVNMPLMKDAQRDFGDIGGDPNLIFDLHKIKLGTPIKQQEGILFTTYKTLAEGLEASGERVKAKEGKKTRIDQIVDWLGKDFDGVIVFDEAHKMGNSIAQRGKRGMQPPAASALAGIELQRRLPNARVVYASATGATEVRHLAFAERLGLWGEGTPFASKMDFIEKVASGGLAAMELVARDMKAMGVYLARNLDYTGVTYGTLEHQLTEEQKEIYDTLARAWQIVLQNIDKALEVTNASPHAKMHARSQFWAAQQRFFNQILISMQMPSVIEQVKKDLEQGHAVVMQLVNTNEAIQNRQLAEVETEEELEDLDLTPRDILMQYLDKSFPTQQYEVYTDEDGNIRIRPVYDSMGRPVHNQEALEAKERLMNMLGALKVPEGPLEMVLRTFGVENVAEVTGRTRRVVWVKDEDGRIKPKIETRTSKHAEADATAFMDDKKRILIFSDAGGTGRSYHADKTKKNQRKRIHYLIQPGWRADNAIQGLGRTHRTNEASAPHYILVTTNLKGHKRFISTIARRLDQLGALTKGQRQAGSQGLFGEKDNLENVHAQDALQRFYEDLANNQIEGLDPEDILNRMGLRDALLDDRGNLKQNFEVLRDITRFLNRILVLETDLQNKVFDEFAKRFEAMIVAAIANGTLDVGLENYRADKIKVVDEKIVYTEEKSGAETKYIELEASHKIIPTTFKEVERLERLIGFYRNTRSGKVYAVRKAGQRTSETGRVVRYYRLYDQVRSHLVSEDDFKRGNYEELSREEARELWEEELKKVPEYRTERIHLISGTLLPIWDRLPEGHVRVYRLKTDDGRVLLGRLIPARAVDTTLRRLGAERTRPQYTPAEIVDKILNENYEVYLANDWKIVRRRVSGEYRIEIIGADLWRHTDQLQKEGVFTERINFQTRYFIPTGEKAAEVLANVTKYRPIVDVIPPATSGTEVPEIYSLKELDELKKRADAVLAKRVKGAPKEKDIYGLPAFAPQKTSVKQVARGLRLGVEREIFKKGMVVADVGGGLYDQGTQYLAEHGITNLVYDPYARSEEHNNNVIRQIKENGGADAVALNNVLNVIPKAEERADVLRFSYALLKNGGQMVVTVYEGNRSGKGSMKEFKDGTYTWQENRPLDSYEKEIREALPGALVEKKYGAFIITKPAKEKVSDIYGLAEKKKRAKVVSVDPQLEEPSKLSPKAAREISERLVIALNTAARSTRMGRKFSGARGAYEKTAHAIRTRRAYFDQWRTVGHEIGHAFFFKANFKPDSNEMVKIVQAVYPSGQAAPKTEIPEGFAEFFMLWFADNAEARRLAPNTAKKLEEYLNANPQLQEVFDQATAIAEEDLLGTPLERMRHLTIRRGSRLAPSVGEYQVPWWKRLTFRFVDASIPLQDLYKEAASKGYDGLDPAKLYAIWGMAREEANQLFAGKARFKYGGFVLPDKRSLQEIVEEAAKIPNGVILFNDIYKALRYQERAEKGFVTPYPKEELDKAVEQARRDYPEIVKLVEEYAETLSEINLRLLVAGEVISEETANRIRKGSKYYLPLYYPAKGQVRATAQDPLRSSGPGVMRYRGHTAQTLDFIEATLLRLHDTIQAVEINRMMRTIEKSLKQPGMGRFGVIVERPVVVKALRAANLLGQIERQIEADILGELNPDDETRVIKLFMPGLESDLKKSEPIVVARHGDKSVFIRLAPDLFEAVQSMRPIQYNWLTKVLTTLAQVSRFGALTNIRYLTNAFMRDIIGSAIQSKTTFERSMIKGYMKGALVAAGFGGENAETLFDLYIQSGAYGSAVQEVLNSMRRSVVTDGLLATPAPGWKRTAKNTFVRIVNAPLDILRIAEEAPRIAEFEAVLKKELAKHGLTLDDMLKGNVPENLIKEAEKALVEAAYASREVVVNFGLQGTSAGWRRYTRTVPFLQGGVQGIYRAYRQVKTDPTGTMVRWLVYVLPLTLLAWVLSHDDDRYRDMPSEARDAYWWFPVGKATFIALAKPYEYALPANILERFLDWLADSDDPNRRKPLEDLTVAVKKAFSVQPASMAVNTIWDLARNKNFFGSPIVPQREIQVSPEYRYGPETKKASVKLAQIAARFMGEKAPSPRQIDYFMKGVFGGAGETFLDILSFPLKGPGAEKRAGIEYMPILGPLVYGPAEGGSRIVDRFYQDYDKAQRLYNDYRLHGRKLTSYEARLVAAIPAMRAIADDLAELRRELREIEMNPDLTPERKRQARLRYNWIARMAAGFLYGAPVPEAPPETGITEAHVQDYLRYYDNLVATAIERAMKREGGPI
ncbi:MAG: strawberry notch-like NTP hydrolase domain-containing protein [Moorellales bacterium]